MAVKTLIMEKKIFFLGCLPFIPKSFLRLGKLIFNGTIFYYWKIFNDYYSFKK